ncbi:MAG: transglutaminase-like domain-containing protein [Limnohabitans sp.]|nr:transglutaminase-like domain-containing protein [Limnohabitans sp.]
MRKKIKRTLLFVFLGFIIYSFWFSPSLLGLIPMGKDSPDQNVEKLQFDTITSNNYKLEYEDLSNDSNLKTLKNEYKLDTIISNVKTDFEKVIKMQSWVHSRWIHDGENKPEKQDALFILKEAEKGKRFRCVEYGIVTKQCLSSLGLKIRTLGLMTKDIDNVKSGAGHVVNEVYLKDLKKWIFMDPQWDVIPVLNGTPLNAIELQNCIAHHKDFDIINPSKTTTKEEYKNWIGPYLYFFTVSINSQKIGIWDMMIGNKKQLTLLPIGATEPTYFQNVFRIRTANYTHSIKDFYPKPD